MTQEDKALLLKDLCARLPYGVKALNKEEIIKIRAYIQYLVIDEVGISHAVEDCKLYLFPLSSMTIEQQKEANIFDDMDMDILSENLGRNHRNKQTFPLPLIIILIGLIKTISTIEV